ncbi:2-dehydropantoate 2-reductase [Pueribacillus theae]|uniref:2-dehydropantoate 2-reductase n=1 Tax=Pueribacillus theae TaxID=2171751 RepID=A0A2U1JVQ9_9BACI|nr:ketopantoate reductase family protein [Pueribacillus theae]PWA09065.1 2-dehydropantoate 2-reductase [Pueribacillus theae]
MNITVIGAGAVGGYFGARLQEAGAKVTFLVREKRKKQIEENGFKVMSVKGDTILHHVSLESDASNISSSDLVIVAVKGYHLDGVLLQLEQLVSKGAKILPLLNGMEHYEILQQKFGRSAVVGGLCFIITTLDENGYIIHTSNQHDIVFGPLEKEQKEVCDKANTLMEKANMNVTYTEDILKQIWNKYAFITAYSGVTTATRLEIGAIREVPETLALYRETAEEMQKLAAAYGIDLGSKFSEDTVEKAFHLPENATSSMHQDFRKGLPLEVESLQGGALRLAKEKGVDLPVVRTLYRLIKPYEKQ